MELHARNTYLLLTCPFVAVHELIRPRAHAVCSQIIRHMEHKSRQSKVRQTHTERI
jgi:hypothetical protein